VNRRENSFQKQHKMKDESQLTLIPGKKNSRKIEFPEKWKGSYWHGMTAELDGGI